MSLEDAAFVFGVFVAPSVVIVVLPLVLVWRTSGRMVAAVSALSAVIAGSLVVYWATWGVAFDDLDAGGEVSPGIDLTANISIAVSAVASLLLLALGAVSLAAVRSRNRAVVGFARR